MEEEDIDVDEEELKVMIRNKLMAIKEHRDKQQAKNQKLGIRHTGKRRQFIG